MKKITFLVLSVFITCLGFSQTVIFSDNFDTYTVGEHLASQSTDWTTWTNNPGSSEDAMVSDAQAYSGTQSMNIIANNDMIYDFGNKTSGIYQLDFYYYVVAGAEAYFNTQHIFGSQWAFSCTFVGGTMTLANGLSTSPTSSYTEDTWMHFSILYNMEEDSAYLHLDDTEISAWTFSNEESGGTGDNQLGCFNFYGPASNNYFVDDFIFTEIESGLLPATVDITTDPITTNGTAPESITVGNTGEEVMNYSAYPEYLWGVDRSGSRDGVLNYDGDNNSAIGWSSSFDVEVAARFLPEYSSEFAGQAIESVNIYINDAPTNDSVRIFVWGKGGFIIPGTSEIIEYKDATVTSQGWNTITLDSPVEITGDEIWVGYGFNHPANTYVLGIDSTDLVDNGNYLKTGVAWSEFDGIQGNGMGNFNIRANVTGGAMPQWMSLTPAHGMIDPDANQTINLDFNTDEIETGIYHGNVIVGCNDPESEWNEIPVTLDYTVGVDGLEANGIMTYPNPVNDYLYIKSDQLIKSVEVYNINGQLIENINTEGFDIKLDLSDKSGVYIIRTTTVVRTAVQQIVVE